MKANVNISYNASKLAKKLPNIIENFLKSYGESSAKESRKSIDEMRHGEKLSKLSIKSRVAGNHPSGVKIKSSSVTPLKWSGNLYTNIKGTKKGLQLPKYGWYHHTGNTWGGTRRPFIEFKLDEKALRRLRIQIKEGLKK